MVHATRTVHACKNTLRRGRLYWRITAVVALRMAVRVLNIRSDCLNSAALHTGLVHTRPSPRHHTTLQRGSSAVSLPDERGAADQFACSCSSLAGSAVRNSGTTGWI